MAQSGKALGIQASKLEDPNGWYTEVINKADLIDYTEVSGCYILRPKSQHIWDTIRNFMDARLKPHGVRNASFPLLIPEHLLKTEEEHVEGFAPEVAWVTHAGETKLAERLAIRPTSETIMYPAYAKWIRNYKDLPLRLNQWCSVIRWEFKHPLPFLRSREFHWQEGHSAFATEDEARTDTMNMLKVYKQTYGELLAVPVLIGAKTEREKFAGAVQTLSCEAFLPIGKAVQGCTSHYLGTNFAKAFGVEYVGNDQQKHFAHQNSWGFSTRSIGVMIMMHSDDHGLVIPPRVAENRIIIVPVFSKDNNEPILKFCREIVEKLSEHEPLIDERENHTLGWRINDAELKGYPLRIEVGPREMAQGTVTLVRRDTLKKETYEVKDLTRKIPELLDEMHENLFLKAKEFLDSNIVEEYESVERIKELVESGKIVKTAYLYGEKTDDVVREKTGGKTLVVPFEEKVDSQTCLFTGERATALVYIAKSI